MFCKSCGTQFASSETPVCQTCGILRGRGVAYCNNCGYKLENRESTCSRCEAVLEYKISRRSKVMAGMLGVSLGTFGLHNFYLGYDIKGYIQLAMAVLGIFTFGIFTFISAIWGFSEGFLILLGVIKKDADGNRLRI
jgi:Predicted membrane protein